MGEKTLISWCDSTVNFWSGCEKVSVGCANCYAESMSKRAPKTFGQWGPSGERKLHESAFKEAIKLNKKPWICETCGRGSDRHYDHSCTGRPEDACHTANVNWHRRRIFSLSLGDWLDPKVPIEWLARMMDTVRLCPDVDWLLVTKRPELWRQRINQLIGFDEPLQNNPHLACWLEAWCMGRAPANVWVIASAENQEMLDKRVPELLKIPSMVRGLSCEPLLGPINLRPRLGFGKADGAEINWVILGGESGPKARPCNVDWIRSGVEQCKAAGVPGFVKQLGSTPGRSIPAEWRGGNFTQAMHLKHPKGGDPSEWPEYLRVRQWPEVSR